MKDADVGIEPRMTASKIAELKRLAAAYLLTSDLPGG